MATNNAQQSAYWSCNSVTELQVSKMAEASGGESCSSTDVSSSDDKMGRSVSVESQKEKPICILCLGMAGSGKTTFVQVF